MTTHRAVLATLTLCLCAMTTPSVRAQSAAAPAPSPCKAGEHHQFDFWIGRWNVFDPSGKKVGENVIEAIDGGCALLERWRGDGGFTGSSLNSWNASSKQWHQHWVDNQGGLLRLSGGLAGERMVLESTGPHPKRVGATLRQRITWSPLPDGAVRQHWEQSENHGATWTTVFDGRYVRQR